MILRAPGTNCDRESAFAFDCAGAATDLVHINQVLEQPKVFEQYQILCLPGGFSYGDDIASGRILGNQILHHLAEPLQKFKSDGKLILGICNGFQILIKSGLLLDDDATDGPPATLDWNVSGKFEDRWVHLSTAGTNCVFLNGIEQMYLPVAHGEGQFVPRSDSVLSQLDANGQLVLRYANAAIAAAGNGVNGAETTASDAQSSAVAYPANPNGSAGNVAGICDTTGRVFGLMPHPERHIDRTHHPRWTRGEGQDPGDGLQLFVNAVDYFK